MFEFSQSLSLEEFSQVNRHPPQPSVLTECAATASSSQFSLLLPVILPIHREFSLGLRATNWHWCWGEDKRVSAAQGRTAWMEQFVSKLLKHIFPPRKIPGRNSSLRKESCWFHTSRPVITNQSGFGLVPIPPFQAPFRTRPTPITCHLLHDSSWTASGGSIVPGQAWRQQDKPSIQLIQTDCGVTDFQLFS